MALILPQYFAWKVRFPISIKSSSFFPYCLAACRGSCSTELSRERKKMIVLIAPGCNLCLFYSAWPCGHHRMGPEVLLLKEASRGSGRPIPYTPVILFPESQMPASSGSPWRFCLALSCSAELDWMSWEHSTDCLWEGQLALLDVSVGLK